MRTRSQVLTHLRKQGERDLTRSQKTSIIDAEKYIAENKIEEMMNELLAQVIAQRPKDLKSFLKEQLELQIKMQGDNFYFSRKDFEAIFLNYDFFSESKVPTSMLVQALGLTGVQIDIEELIKRYPKFENQVHVLKEEFIQIMLDEYHDKVKKYRKTEGDEDYAMHAIAADSFINDILIYCDMELLKRGCREELGCMKRIVDYMIQNAELCIVEQFQKAIQPDLNPQQLVLILNSIGLELLDRGYFKQSESFLNASLQQKIQVYGEASIEVGKVYNNFGLLKRQKGEYDSAKEYFQKALKIYSSVYGKDHLACVEILENKAVLLRSQDKYEEALEQYNQVLEIKKTRYGVQHLETMATVENMAIVLIKQGKLDEAIENLKKVQEVKRRKEGENSLSYAGTLHNISIALEAKKEHHRALKISKNALQISKNESLTNSFVRTVENHVKILEEHLNEALDVSQEI